VPGSDFADDLQLRWNAFDINGAHGVTIHGRDVSRRLRAQGRNSFCQHTAMCFQQWDHFGWQRFCLLQHAPERFGNRHQRHV
jgi:hypothetical protein